MFLIRHASLDLLGETLCGRMPDMHLNERGREEARRLTRHLADCHLSAIYASPLPRARETAAPLANHHGLAIEITAGLNEIDFGSWTGRRFAALSQDPRWRHWNERRGAARPPGGESMREVQSRAVEAIEEARQLADDGALAFVSHGDVLKAIVAFYIGVSLDDILRFELLPASVTTLVDDGDIRLLRLNEVAP
jgi:broad specificity phosphatase PhoE